MSSPHLICKRVLLPHSMSGTATSLKNKLIKKSSVSVFFCFVFVLIDGVLVDVLQAEQLHLHI